VWERTEMSLLSKKENQDGHERRDVFEQDVDSRKVTRVLDLLHKLLVL